MKIAYVILAYKYPEQLSRLINILRSERSAFFVHIDKKVDISGFRSALGSGADDIVFLRRENSSWGSVGSVKAVLNGIRQVLDSSIKFDYIYVMSGQHYPIKTIQFIEEFFGKDTDKSHIQCMKLPDGCWGKEGGMDRISRYHPMFLRNRHLFKITQLCLRYLNFVLPPKTFPPYIKTYYGGEFMFGFNRYTAKYIMTFTENHPDFIDFFKYVICADEIFFQTLLMNSDDEKVLSNIVNTNLTYVDWSGPPPNPAILKRGDFDKLLSTDKLFARKFDTTVDSKILDIIDERIFNRA